MIASKENLHLTVSKLFSFFSSRCFHKEIENMSSVFQTRKFGTTRKICGNTRQRFLFPQHFSFSKTSTQLSIALRWLIYIVSSVDKTKLSTNVARVRFPDPCHKWVEFLGSLLCSEWFYAGYSGFPLSPKTNI